MCYTCTCMHIHVHAYTHTCVHIMGVNQHDSALLYNLTIQWGQGAFMHRVCSLYFTCNCMDYYMFTNLRREHTYDNISFAPFNNADMCTEVFYLLIQELLVNTCRSLVTMIMSLPLLVLTHAQRTIMCGWTITHT